MRALGLDLSVTGTGVVCLEPGEHPKCVFEEEYGSTKLRGAQRTQLIALQVMKAIHELNPDVILMEGYAPGKFAGAIIPVVELGGVVRLMLHLDGLSWGVAAPTSLKKFATGTGNAKKEQVMMFVQKNWSHTSKTNNTADAYVLAVMGLAHKGQLPKLSAARQDALGKIEWCS